MANTGDDNSDNHSITHSQTTAWMLMTHVASSIPTSICVQTTHL
jgi:hypothetical protein